MKLHYFIATKFLLSNEGVGKFTGVISKIGLAVGSFALIISISVLNGFESKVIDRIRNFEGDVRITGLNINKNIDDVLDIENIKLASANRERKGLLNYNLKNKIVVFKEIDIDMIDDFYHFPIIGNLPKVDEVLIGYDIALRLGIKIDDEVLISSPLDQSSPLGFPPAFKVIVSGFFKSRILDYDDNIAFISKDIGSKLFNHASILNFIDLKLKNNTVDIDKLKNNLNNIYTSEIKVETWKERHHMLAKAMMMEKVGSIITLSLIILVASFNMSATLSLLTLKKIKDIAILRVLGARIIDLKKILIYQSFLIGGKGSLVGILLGLLLVTTQNMFGFIILPNEIYSMDTLPMILSIKDITLIVFLCCFFIFFPGLIAGSKVSKYNLMESIKWIK